MAEDWFEVVVEIPRGSRNKYEIDHDTGDVWLDRHLFQATVYPMEYGFFPETLADDDDPLGPSAGDPRQFGDGRGVGVRQ